MPSDARDAANKLLRETYGFGYELFTDRRLKRLRTILRKGRISNDDEFREISAVASDTEIYAEFRGFLDTMLANYESQRVQSPKKSSVATLKKLPQQ